MKSNMKLPTSFKPYFWDVRFEDIHPEENAFFVIKRVLDRGNTPAIQWILKTYSLDEIKHVIMTTRDISRRTANFWATILHIPQSQVVCLQKPYARIPFGPFN